MRIGDRWRIGLGLALCMVVTAAAQAWSGEAGIGYDSNVANVREGGNERSDQFAQLTIGTDSVWRLSADSGLLWRLQLDGQQFAAHHELSNLQALLQARWLYRPGSGFYAPTLELVASAAWWEFDSQLRDSAQYRLGLFAAEQLTTDISLRAGWRATVRDSRDTVFDAGVRSLSLDLDWLLQPSLTLYLGYQHLDGDQVSTAAVAAAAARAASSDDAFPGEVAFRLSSTAGIGTLGLNYALNPRLALDLQARQVRARADSGTRYERSLLLGSLLWRY